MEAPSSPRSPWQLLYGAAHRLRRAYWASHAERLPRPVISIGNLHWGGGGKTPLVAAVATWLRDQGWRPAILSRGYGGRGRGVRIVSTGEGPLLGPLVAGDEPVLLAAALPGVAVVVAPNRVQAGRHALERLDPKPGIFVLDDGFSHLRLCRDLDLLVFPAADPFAGGRLLPAGRLREPLAAAVRADAALLSGAVEHADAERLGHILRDFGFRGPSFASRSLLGSARLRSQQLLPPGTRVLLVAGIARPEPFFRSARELGYEVASTIAFPDHHPYPAASLNRITQTLAEHRAQAVLTTSKDRVKLEGRLEAPLADLPLSAEPEAAFWDWLEGRLRQWR
jgi:tetraacyldisaccharide 4'-kinase